MLPRFRRIPRNLFPIIAKQGRPWRSPGISLAVWRGPGAFGPAKFSVVAGVKFARRATERNLWKRRGRAVIEKLAPQVRENHCAVLFLGPAAKLLSYQQLAAAVENLFRRAGLF